MDNNDDDDEHRVVSQSQFLEAINLVDPLKGHFAKCMHDYDITDWILIINGDMIKNEF